MKTGIEKVLRRPVYKLFLALASFCVLVSVAPALSADTLGDEARNAGKPMIVDFGMTRCAQCIEEGKVMDRLKAEFGDKAIFRFVHVGKEEQTAADCKILMIPAIVFYDKTGKEVFRNVGFMDYDAVMKKVKEVGLLN